MKENVGNSVIPETKPESPEKKKKHTNGSESDQKENKPQLNYSELQRPVSSTGKTLFLRSLIKKIQQRLQTLDCGQKFNPAFYFCGSSKCSGNETCQSGKETNFLHSSKDKVE